MITLTGGSQGGLLLMRELVRLHYGVFEEVAALFVHHHLPPSTLTPRCPGSRVTESTRSNTELGARR